MIVVLSRFKKKEIIMSKFILLANPSSKGKQGKKIIEQIEQYCHQNIIDYTLYLSHSTEHLQQLALSIAKQYAPPQKVVVIGGDGTLHHVVQTLFLNQIFIPIGYVPSGTGNDFARSVFGKQSPLTIFKQLISATQPTAIPILSTKKHIALNSFGVGFDAQVCQLVEQTSIKEKLNRMKLGFLTYPVLVLKALRSFKTFSITINKQTYNNVAMTTFVNNPSYGGGIIIDPSIALFEKQTNAIIIHDVTFTKIVSLLWQLSRKKHLSHPCVTQLQETEHFSVNFDTHLPTQADGEPNELGTPPVIITLNSFEFWI